MKLWSKIKRYFRRRFSRSRSLIDMLNAKGYKVYEAEGLCGNPYSAAIDFEVKEVYIPHFGNADYEVYQWRYLVAYCLSYIEHKESLQQDSDKVLIEIDELNRATSKEPRCILDATDELLMPEAMFVADWHCMRGDLVRLMHHYKVPARRIKQRAKELDIFRHFSAYE